LNLDFGGKIDECTAAALKKEEESDEEPAPTKKRKNTVRSHHLAQMFAPYNDQKIHRNFRS
jgi:hypothetical protein